MKTVNMARREGGCGEAKRDGLSLVACEYCDAVYRRTELVPGCCAECLRCGGRLYRQARLDHAHQLPLSLAALLLFLIANANPIVLMSLRGTRVEATLWDAVQALYMDGMAPVAALVGVTTILFPLAELLLLIYLRLALVRRRIPRGFARVLRCIQWVRPWGMIEVFMVGVLVTVVKLSVMAEVLPGVALWAFGLLVFLLALLLSFDLPTLWRQLERARAMEQGLRE
ncbi:paraquat-inducible protein A [Chromobacterium paludis]|uniref:Paraquat-inducible protein A n=1 Tax=Chromobacterium paludis TaxID=2605945 RepID=A0A5C1DHZ6_9NEIS|nr:paraquat-inducible protein A [Chromobacterium paludis]QEL55637.1 paraquat-inducible protein A [Chromobacterium paludis]